MSTKTSDLKSQRKIRLEKVEKLKKIGLKPYPSKIEKTASTTEIKDKYSQYENQEVKIAGRIMTWREHGKLYFVNIRDEFGEIQIYIKKDVLEKYSETEQNLGWENLELLDIGDFIGVEGTVTKTKRGEISILAEKIRIGSKAIRPLPEKWHGLKDDELRYRRRYLDMTMNPEVREMLKRKSKFWNAHREFLNKNGFTEINVPVLEHIPGGGDAKPFTTHMNAIDENLFLRISQELTLKRMLGAGFEKVYDIGPRFRNEGLSDEHQPEHYAMEFYWAYANWRDGMAFTKDMFMYMLENVYDGEMKFNIRGFEIDFSKKWDEIDFREVVNDNFGVDVLNPDLKKIEKILRDKGVEIDFTMNKPRGVDNLWKLLRKDIAGPAFLINHPIYLSPLQKPNEDDPRTVERYQLILAGSEMGNGWSELNEPVDQYNRFMEQQKLRDSGDDEAQWLDIDYVEMLEYGMPPSIGFGYSERTFWFLEDISGREAMPIPMLKQLLDKNTIEIYGEEIVKIYESHDNDLKKGIAGESTLHKKNNHKSENVNSKNGADPENDRENPTSKSNLLLKIPETKEEALEILDKNVTDQYQNLHSRMVANAMERYAEKLNEDKFKWYLTGLFHDLDFNLFPDAHPETLLGKMKELEFDEDIINAIGYHAPHTRDNYSTQSDLSRYLLAVDELSGLLYAYSLMRPEGFIDMKAKSIKKKLKDKAFAAKIDREEILMGVELAGLEVGEHSIFLASIFAEMDEFKSN